MNDTVYKVLSHFKQGSKNSFVFPSARKPGHEMRDHKKGFRKAVQMARIAHIRFHDLRHTSATRMVLQGVDLITVQQLLGHAKITTTARYAHTADKNQDRRGEEARPARGLQPGPGGVRGDSV